VATGSTDHYKKRKLVPRKDKMKVSRVRPWDNIPDPISVPKKDPRLSWKIDPGILWLKRQCVSLFFWVILITHFSDATGWRRYMPNMSEVTSAPWPGFVPVDGLTTVHLTPDCLFLASGLYIPF